MWIFQNPLGQLSLIRFIQVTRKKWCNYYDIPKIYDVQKFSTVFIKWQVFSLQWNLIMELWPSSKVWIFQNPLAQLLIRFLSITKTNLVYLSFIKMASLQPSLEPSKYTFASICSVLYDLFHGYGFFVSYALQRKKKKTIAVKDILSFFCTCSNCVWHQL